MNRDTPNHDELTRELPDPPSYGFVGRRKELRDAAEILARERHLVIRGEYGEGRSSFAGELVRQLLDTGQFERAAFVRLQVHHDARGVNLSLGQQLIPRYRLAVSQDPRLAAQLLERVLAEQRSLVVLDHMEAVMPPILFRSEEGLFEPSVLDQVLVVANELREIGETRVVFTCRSVLPDPFATNEIHLGALDPSDAAELMRRVIADRDATIPDDLEGWAERVSGHTRSVVALAAEIAASGSERTGATLAECFAALPDLELEERRRALLLGVELALRTLPTSVRDKIPPLGVFHGGGHLTAIAAVLGLDVENDEEVEIAESLIGAGLAEMLPNNYLRFHPGLAAALRAELEDPRLEAAGMAWREAVSQLMGFLSQEQIRNPSLAASLARYELRNLLACLDAVRRDCDPDLLLETAGLVESLIGPLRRPQALAQVEKLRQEASRGLGEWNRDQYITASAALEVLLDSGRTEEAIAAAKKLVHRIETVGEGSYDGASFDVGTLHMTLGLAHLMASEAEPAMAAFEQARQHFHDLAQVGREAARMEAETVARTGDALRALEFPDAAAEHYETAVKTAAEYHDRHQVAEIKTRLAELRLEQGRIREAIAVYQDAHDIFTALDENATVAGICHQLAAIHADVRDFAAARAATQKALDLEMSQGNREAAANSLGELGSFYAEMGLYEEALKAFAQASDLFAELGDLAAEAVARSQAADKLTQLGRLDAARRELERAIDCEASLGHEAEPWRTFSMLARLEEKAGHEQARLSARNRAVEAYLRYRRDGGRSRGGHAEIFAEVSQAIAREATADVSDKLAGMLSRNDLPTHLRALIPALQRVLDGSRDPALAGDPQLYYRDAAELLLQLETIEEKKAAETGHESGTFPRPRRRGRRPPPVYDPDVLF